MERKPRLFDWYSGAADGRARYAIGRRGPNPLVVVGLNPSRADPWHSDTTLSKVAGFARRMGHGGFVVFNLYPWRATCPDDLPAVADPRLLRRNTDCIARFLRGTPNPTVWAAWGDPIDKRPYLFSSLARIRLRLDRTGCRWIHLGSPTAKGHPRHPSRLAYASPARPFDVAAYLSAR